MKSYQIAVIKADGIGPEVCETTLEAIRRVLSDPRRLHFAKYPPRVER